MNLRKGNEGLVGWDQLRQSLSSADDVASARGGDEKMSINVLQGGGDLWNIGPWWPSQFFLIEKKKQNQKHSSHGTWESN